MAQTQREGPESSWNTSGAAVVVGAWGRRVGALVGFVTTGRVLGLCDWGWVAVFVLPGC